MAEVPKSIRASLYIDGKPAESSLKNIRQVTNTLRRELDGLVVGTEAWNKKMRELQVHERTLRNIQNEVKGVGGAFGWLKTELGKLGGLAVGYLGFQFITSQFHNIILANAKLSDSLADVRRTVGLTEDEVMRLNKSFKELDTRTSVEQLRNIAIIAGKLGVAKNDVLGFVEATDKLVVTLGDELGDADQITTQLGKILNVFEGKVNGDNISHLGNAIIELANDGVASGGFIADFTQRVSGLAKTANLSLGATLGLAAGLEELGQRSESSSTAVSKLLNDIAGDLPAAARVAKQPLAEFQSLFAKNPEQALLAYASGLVKNKQAFSEVSAALAAAGEDGQRVVQVIAALGNKAEFMQEKIDLGNKSLGEMSAINEGFALKNETFGATVDKLGKKFSEFAANRGLTDMLKSLINLTGSAIDGINKHAVALSRLTKFAIAGGVAWLTYSTYLALSRTTLFALLTAMVKGESILAISRTATIALAGAKAVLSGNITKATQAWRLLNVTIEANPIGAVIAALAAVVTMVVLFKDTTNDAAKAQQTLNKIKDEAIEKTAEERDKIDSLNKIIQNQNEKYSDRLLAIKRLRELMPDHLKAYSDEEILAGKAAAAINDYAKSLIRRAEAEEASDELKRLQKERREIDRKGGELGFGDSFEVVLTDIFQGSEKGDALVKKRSQENLTNARRTNDEQQKAIYEKYGLDFKNETLGKQGNGTGGTTGGTTADTTIGARKAALEAQIKDLETKYDQLNETDKKGIAANLSMRRSLQKQLDALDGTADKKNQRSEESEAKKRLTEFEKLGKEYEALGVQALNDQLSRNEKEVAQEEQKYDKLIDDYVAFYNKKGATKAQREDALQKIGELTFQKEDAVNALRVRQEAAMNDRLKQLRIDLGVLHESELEKEKARINKFYDEEERNAAGNEQTLAMLKLARQQDLTQAELNEAKRLQQEKEQIEAGSELAGANRDNKRLARINKKYDDEILALKLKFSKEIQATQEFQDAIDSINANRKAEIDAEDVERRRAFKDAELATIQEVANAAFQISANNRHADSEARISQLERQRDQELNNKNLTEAQKKRINEKYDAEVREEKKKAWEADRRASLAQAVINGAVAFTKALGSAFPPFNWINAGAVAASTAMQVAVIASEKAPQFAVGGFTDSDPAGYVSNATLFRNSATGRPFIAGEAGREWVAPAWMLQNPRTANVINMLEIARRDKRAFAAGGFTSVGMAGTPAAAPFDYSLLAQQNQLLMMQNEKLAALGDKFDAFSQKPWEFSMRAFQDKQAQQAAISNKARF